MIVNHTNMKVNYLISSKSECNIGKCPYWTPYVLLADNCNECVTVTMLLYNENMRCSVDLAEDKKETDMNTSDNSRDCSWIEH